MKEEYIMWKAGLRYLGLWSNCSSKNRRLAVKHCSNNMQSLLTACTCDVILWIGINTCIARMGLFCHD